MPPGPVDPSVAQRHACTGAIDTERQVSGGYEALPPLGTEEYGHYLPFICVAGRRSPQVVSQMAVLSRAMTDAGRTPTTFEKMVEQTIIETLAP